MNNRRVMSAVRNPARLVLGAFVTLILLGSVLLWLPLSVDAGTSGLGWRDALFSSTSATTVTGLSTVDVTQFSLFGELVLLGLIQLGGFGIMTVGSVLALTLSRRLGMRQRMLARAEIGAVDIGELRYLIGAIARITVFAELAVAAMIVVPLARTQGVSVVSASYSAIFHGVSAFNNAGISLYPDSLTAFAGEPFVVFPVTAAFIVGGLGFPVLVELWHKTPPRRWSLHTRITLSATAALLVIGPLSVLAFEWRNASTLGLMDSWDKLQAAWFQGVTPRTAGFNTVDIGEMRPTTLLVTAGLMFVGAGPASTSGGIKVTTAALLAVAMWSEVRGGSDVSIFRRRVPDGVVRQAMTVALLSVGLVFGTTLALTAMSSLDPLATFFEATSAFGTVGLSTGITSALPGAGQLLLILLMLAGRVGPVTFATALALRHRPRVYRFAEERPIIG